MYNFSPAISKATRWIRRKTSWKMIMNLEKYGTNCKENVEKSFWTLCECCRRNLRGNQIKRYSFYLLLDHSFKASSPPPGPLPQPFNLFIDTGVILSYEMVSKCFNTFRRLDYNKIKKLRGDSFSQLVRLREL